MEITPEIRQQAKQALAIHLAAMGYGHPDPNRPTYTLTEGDDQSVLAAVFAAKRFINPHRTKD